MAIMALPLPPGAEARALLHHILEHGDVMGRDTMGRTIIQLAVDDWTLEKLMSFDTEAAELEDEGPCTQRIDRLIDLFEQIRDGGRQGPGRLG